MNDELLQTAARLIAEEGLDYSSAKRRAAQQLGIKRAPHMDNLLLEQAVRDYLQLFHGDTQPLELQALRTQALQWMERLDGTTALSPAHDTLPNETYRPHLSGAVWRGTATRLNDIYIAVFCDDPKATEITLINWGIHYETGDTHGMLGKKQTQRLLPILAFTDHNTLLDEPIGILLTVYEYNDLRGILQPDSSGMTRCGNIAAVRALLNTATQPYDQ